MNDKYAKCFITKKTYNNKTIFVLREDCDLAQKLSDLVRKIHFEFDAIPNDWIYENIYDCFKIIELNGDVSWLQSDVYTKDLVNWLQENPFADDLMEETITDGLIDHRNYSFDNHIRIAQILAKQKIFMIVEDFVNKQSER